MPEVDGAGQPASPPSSPAGYAALLGGATAAVGATAFFGWLIGVPQLASVSRTFIPMAPNTALGFVLVGATITAHARSGAPRLLKSALAVLTSLFLLLALLRLLDALFALQLGTDGWILKPSDDTRAGFPIGVMSPVTATSFLLIGAALLLRAFATRRTAIDRTASFLAIAGLTIGLGVVLGYVYGSPFGYRGGKIIPVALTTGVAFVLAGAGVVASIGRTAWPLPAFTGQSVRARLMRAFIPIVVAVVLIEAWLALNISAGEGNPAVFAAVTAVISVALFSGVVAVLARRIGGEIESAEAERLRLSSANEAAKTEAAAARKESEFKSKFLATMSHELRTPLNAIIGFSELLEQQVFGPLNTKQAHYVQNVLSGGRHLLTLVNDILDLSKIQAGRMTLSREWLSFELIADAVHGAAHALADKKGLTLELTHEGTVPQVYVDAVRMKQILYNLLSNAIKFTPKGGKVVLRARSTGEQVEISVEDNGAGIKEEDLPKLFREFEQLAPAHGDHQEGTGLGLALTQRLVELHGGSVSVESKHGSGSTFTVRLPARATVDGELESDAATKDTPLVLVVEDEAAAAELIAGHLRGAGLAVAFARNTKEGRRIAEDLTPRAITLDINMQGENGWTLLADLKSSPNTAAIPVIVVSVIDEPQHAEMLGASGFVMKPVSSERLLLTLERLGVSIARLTGCRVSIAGALPPSFAAVYGHLRLAGCVIVRDEDSAREKVDLTLAVAPAGTRTLPPARPLVVVGDAQGPASPGVVHLAPADALVPERLVRALKRALSDN